MLPLSHPRFLLIFDQGALRAHLLNSKLPDIPQVSNAALAVCVCVCVNVRGIMKLIQSMGGRVRPLLLRAVVIQNVFKEVARVWGDGDEGPRWQ